MKKEELVAIINELEEILMGIGESGYCPICGKDDGEDDEHTPECQDLNNRIEQAQGDA